MKNFFISILLIAVTAAVLEQFMPWWAIAVAGFAGGYMIRQSTTAAFFAGFVSIFLLWTVYAFMLSKANNDILATKIAMLLPLKGNVMSLLLVTGLIGGLVGGFATFSGRLAGKS